MKIFIILSFLTLRALAVSWEIHDPCKDRILYKGDTVINFPYPNLGKFTVDRLSENRIPFLGNEVGLSSILKTPQGDDSLVVIRDTEMLAYGWCYHHNGIEPAVMAHEITLKNTDTVKWFFAYSQYKNGQWKTMCAPAHGRPLKSYCH